MTQVCKLKSIITFLFCIVIVCACNSNKPTESKENKIINPVVVENKHYYPKIDSLVNLFDRKEDLLFYEKKLSYSVEDSLCFYFSKLDKSKLIRDDEFKYMAGKLLEKAYLQVREDFYEPESFPVYNMEIYPTGGKLSHHFALNIILETKSCLDSAFVKYARMKREFLCIDSVVLVLDKLPQMQTDSNHQKCMYLVKNNKTGGCKW